MHIHILSHICMYVLTAHVCMYYVLCMYVAMNVHGTSFRKSAYSWVWLLHLIHWWTASTTSDIIRMYVLICMHNYYTYALLPRYYYYIITYYIYRFRLIVVTTSGQTVVKPSTYVGFASVTFDNLFIKSPCGTKNHK